MRRGMLFQRRKCLGGGAAVAMPIVSRKMARICTAERGEGLADESIRSCVGWGGRDGTQTRLLIGASRSLHGDESDKRVQDDDQRVDLVGEGYALRDAVWPMPKWLDTMVGNDW